MQRVFQNLISRCGENISIYLVDYSPAIQKCVAPQCMIEALWRNPGDCESTSSEYHLQLPPLIESPDAELVLSPGMLLAKKDDECKTLEQKKKRETVCKSPDLRPKEIPPYEYGYCKEPEKPFPMSCPPKAIRSKKGPCCHDAGEGGGKGGCRNK